MRFCNAVIADLYEKSNLKKSLSRLQKKITKNQLLQNDAQLIRVLDIEADRVFVIDCIKKTMPVWKGTESINEYVPCSEDTLQEITDTTNNFWGYVLGVLGFGVAVVGCFLKDNH